MAQETSSVHLFPHGSGAIGFVSSMEARLAALEERLKQTEEVLVQGATCATDGSCSASDGIIDSHWRASFDCAEPR